MPTPSALILGASGRIGRRLARALIREEWTVAGAARMSDSKRRRELEEIGVDTIVYEVQEDDPAELPEVDVLFLEIWDPDQPEQQWAINYYGVGRVVERYAGTADIVNGSTLDVYGARETPAREDTPCRPTSRYGRSRYAQERLIDYFCHRSESRGIHLRYAHANAPRHGVIRRMAETILQEQSLGDDPDARIQVIAYEDFIRVTRAAVDHLASPPTVVNCCHPRVWTKRELAETIRNRLGRGTVVFERDEGGVEQSVYGDTERMESLFGAPHTSVDQLVDRVVDELQ